jgi:ribose/xylose/arabinose/galactoside ABC-type transport system permease subunit
MMKMTSFLPDRSPSRGVLLRTGLLLGLSVLFGVGNPVFLSVGNAYALLQSVALLGLVTLGLAITMIAGEFDLAVGSMLAVAGLVTITLLGQGVIVAVAASIAIAIAVGVGNGVVVRWLGVSSLVVTVGMMMFLSGLAFQIAGGKVITTDNFDPGFALDQPILSVLSLRSLITFAAFGICALLMRFTLIGRDIRAVGSLRAVAEASGANVTVALIAAFCSSAVCSAFAGSLLSMSLASASATTGGGIMLQAVSAAIVGGVSLTGGTGSIGGVLVGAFILGVLNNGLSLIGAGSTGILFANGLVLLLVVLADGKAGELLRRVTNSSFQGIPSGGIAKEGR